MKAPRPARGDSGFLSLNGPGTQAARGARGHAVSGSPSGLALPLASQQEQAERADIFTIRNGLRGDVLL